LIPPGLARSNTSPIYGVSLPLSTSAGPGNTISATELQHPPHSFEVGIDSHDLRESLASREYLHTLPLSASSPSTLSPTRSSQNHDTQTALMDKESRTRLLPRPRKHHPSGLLQTFTLAETDHSFDPERAHLGLPSPSQLPPYISPADSPIDRPSTPAASMDLRLEDRIAAAHLAQEQCESPGAILSETSKRTPG